MFAYFFAAEFTLKNEFFNFMSPIGRSRSLTVLKSIVSHNGSTLNSGESKSRIQVCLLLYFVMDVKFIRDTTSIDEEKKKVMDVLLTDGITNISVLTWKKLVPMFDHKIEVSQSFFLKLACVVF